MYPFFFSTTYVSLMLQEKLSNDPLHPSAFIHWNIQHWFHGSDRTRWIESKNVVW